MPAGTLLLVIAALAAAGYWLGKSRSLALVGGGRGIRKLHSLPRYYGLLAALWCGLPCLVVLAGWLAFQDRILTSLVLSGIGGTGAAGPGLAGLLMNDVHNAIAGVVPMDSLAPGVRQAAQRYLELKAVCARALTGVLLVLGTLGIAIVWLRISPALRARNLVERMGQGLLLAAASLAVFVTLGIVLSVVYESVLFFRAVPVHEFLFGLKWSPQIALREDRWPPPAALAPCRCSWAR